MPISPPITTSPSPLRTVSVELFGSGLSKERQHDVMLNQEPGHAGRFPDEEHDARGAVTFDNFCRVRGARYSVLLNINLTRILAVAAAYVETMVIWLQQ
jgi:hypothetical protein